MCPHLDLKLDWRCVIKPIKPTYFIALLFQTLFILTTRFIFVSLAYQTPNKWPWTYHLDQELDGESPVGAALQTEEFPCEGGTTQQRVVILLKIYSPFECVCLQH